MDAARIQARAIAKVTGIALIVTALAVLLAIVLLHTRTTLQWVVIAVFFALAMDPAVNGIERLAGRWWRMPRVLAIVIAYLFVLAIFAFMILQVAPPVVREFEALGSQLPTYIADFKDWAQNSQAFQDLNDKFGITATLTEQAQKLPATLGSAAGSIGSATVTLLTDILAAITIATLSFFLLLDGRRQRERMLGKVNAETSERVRRVSSQVAAIVRAYFTVNLLLAFAAGALTWVYLEVAGFHLALPAAVGVAFLNLIPLVGLSIAGVLVTGMLLLDHRPGAALVWLGLFIVYQQAQDRVIQPVLYGNAVRIHPAAAIIAVLVGAELAGILGALIAIPVAASLAVVIAEVVRGPKPAADVASDDPPAEADGLAPVTT